jgi:hypothetical protein
MKPYLILLLIAIGFQHVSAQKTDHPRVMIIPFDPDMYFNDSDQMLAEYNKKNIKDIRTMFRYGFNVNLNAKIMSEYDSKPLLTDSTTGAMEDLYAIYKGISYFKDKSVPQASTASTNGQPVKTSLFKKSTESEQLKSKLTETDKDGLRTYMNVKIHNVKMLEFLKQKYGCDMFVFINQFNMVTNYETCLDRSTNTFEREIGIHYSVFDVTGKQLAGDVAIVKFPSNSNDIMTIMKENFPIISQHLTKDMPGRVRTQESNVQQVNYKPAGGQQK